MSAYVYAIIPYKNWCPFVPDESELSRSFPDIPELKEMDSELAESDGLTLFPGFVLINTCYRLSSLCDCEDGYSWLRTEVYKIAKALNADEVWYAEELAVDEMFAPDFSFEEWKNELETVKSKYLYKMTVDVLKSNRIYSYYHDNFKDIILNIP